MEGELSPNSSEQSGSSTDDSSSSFKLEKCLLDKSEICVPDELCEREDLFSAVFSMQTWNNVLNQEQRSKLMNMLPKFSDSNEYQNTLENLFSGENFKFGNPCMKFFSKLRDGYYNMDVAKIAKKLKEAQYSEYRHEQRRYYYRLLQDILVSRKKLLQAVADLPPGVPVKMEQLQSSDKAFAMARIEDRTKRRYFREIQEVREECEAMEISSEDENYPEGPPPKLTKKQKKQLHSMEQSLSPDTHRVMSTMSTLPMNGANESSNTTNTLMRLPSMIEITDEQYREMLHQHRKYRVEKEHHPIFDVSDITLEQVIGRASSMKKSLQKSYASGVSEISDKKPNLKAKKKKRSHEPDVFSSDPLGLESNMTIIKPEPCDSQNEVNIMSDSEVPVLTRSVTPSNEIISQRYPNFFCLIREKITNLIEKRATANQLQECIRVWEDSNPAKECSWFKDSGPKKWSELVMSALKFLAGELLGVQPEDFIPYIDYKEKLMQWVWVGHDRDSNEEMAKLCTFWLEKKDDIVLETSDSLQGNPPPPRVSTDWVVKPTTLEEKSTYQSQELLRYQNPHKAFTFCLHSYESVVGPVKGVYGKEMASAVTSKAREHSLLVPSRPSCVTLLSLVRDAVARLPNGQGTRTDISQLLKDSQFIADATDQQLQSVVSGALDRLHYEKDPCVKYDVTRKLWIYLHRNRDEIEFEKIHQAQAQAAKAKKSIPKPKVNRSKNKDNSKSASSAAANQSSSQAINADENESNSDKNELSLAAKINKANLLAQKIIKQELNQANIVKKVDTENITKASQKRNPIKSIPVNIKGTSVSSPTPIKLVGQPQLVRTTQVCAQTTQTTQTRPIFTTVAGVPQVGRVHTRATLAARVASPQLITMQPGPNSTVRVRCTLAQGQRLPQSAVLQTVLSQAARAQLTQALAGHGQPVILQTSSAQTSSSASTSQAGRTQLKHTLANQGQSVILQTTTPVSGVSQSLSQGSRSQLSPAVLGAGQQVIIQSSPSSANRTLVNVSRTVQSTPTQSTVVTSSVSHPQVNAVLTNITKQRKSPVQTTHTILSQMNVGQRPTFLTAVKSGSGHIVQRSISVPDGTCVNQPTFQLLSSQPGITLTNQRISTSQVNIPSGTAKQKIITTQSGSDEKNDAVNPISQNILSNQTLLQLKNNPPLTTETVDKHQGLTSPLTLNSAQNAPSRPSSTGSSQSLPSPKALVASINAAQLVGDINSSNPGECSSPISIPQVSQKADSLPSVSKTQYSSNQPTFVHQLLTKGHLTLPMAEKSGTIKTTMSGITHTVLLKPEAASVLTASSTSSSSTKPVVAHIISSPQVVSMSNLLAQGPKQAIRIHGSNIVRPGQMIGQQVGVLQPCSGGAVSRLALVSPTTVMSSNHGGTTTKLVAVGPGNQLGVVDASQFANLTRGVPSQIHMTSNKSVVINTQSGLKIVSANPGGSSADSTLLSTKSANIASVLANASSSSQSEGSSIVSSKPSSQTYVMAALTGSSGSVQVPTVSGLQNVKVIPVSQPGGKSHIGPPVLARILTPAISLQSAVSQQTAASKAAESVVATKPPENTNK